ncbi:MAG: AzlC family ABC transporter permease [Tissierellia bacterium]|nr:AzlC family ABC transporter permease [Tissierellia bacterium]MDD4781569.1 AzlC family ABC transporter permease [Tissierellia bacterium]
MNEKLKALKAAFPYTIPVFLGYLFIGIAFGVLFENKGYNFLWAILASTLIYAGSMQYVAINLFTGDIGLINIAFITLMVNIRHVFYGLSMIDKFKNMGKFKPYMIFSLTDETYSLLCLTDSPEGINKNYFLFFIALLNQSYWVLGSFIGSVAGSLITINSKGIDFAMTALFVVIFVEQWLFVTSHIPAITGIIISLLCLVIFGSDNFLLPSMLLILIVLTIIRNKIEERISVEKEETE